MCLLPDFQVLEILHKASIPYELMADR